MEKKNETAVNELKKTDDSVNKGYDLVQKSGYGKTKEKIALIDEKTIVNQSDFLITRIIKAEILKDPLLKKFHINVFTHNGIVELNGAVDYQKCVERGKEIANGVDGVKTVVSEIYAKKDDKMELVKQPEIVNTENQKTRNSDSTTITHKIKENVGADQSLKEFQIKVTTVDGVVNISGGVDSLKSIEKIKEIVSKVKGVKTFENHLFLRNIL